MPKQVVLADSSAWIHFLRKGGREPIASALQGLLEQNLVATNWLIRLELQSGTDTETSYEALNEDLAALHQLDLTEPLFQAASLLRWKLHRRGLLIPVVDSLIAACAIHYHCTLLHDDRHFRSIARHAPLKFHPVQETVH